jgi:mannose-6-phosphate isomerase-like protein (cupin superfamily)
MSKDDVVSVLRRYAEEVRAAEVAHAERRMRGLTQSERDLVEAVTTRVMERLLERPDAWFLQSEPASPRERRRGARRPVARKPEPRREGMTSYTVVRINDVENFASQVGLDQDQYQIRLLRSPLGCAKYGVSYERYAAGWRHPFGHRHAEQEEVYVLVSGRMRMKLDDDIIELEPWTAVRVSPETIRGLHNPANQDAELIVIGAPATEEPDYELLAGWWQE